MLEASAIDQVFLAGGGVPLPFGRIHVLTMWPNKGPKTYTYVQEPDFDPLRITSTTRLIRRQLRDNTLIWFAVPDDGITSSHLLDLKLTAAFQLGLAARLMLIDGKVMPVIRRALKYLTFDLKDEMHDGVVRAIEQWTRRSRDDQLYRHEQICRNVCRSVGPDLAVIGWTRLGDRLGIDADSIRTIVEHRSDQPVELFPLDGRPHLAHVRVETTDVSSYQALLGEVTP